MYNGHKDRFTSVETTCGLLLLELQKLWDEVGDDDAQRDKMLFEIEQECLQVYKEKVEKADGYRSELIRQIDSAEDEIQRIRSVLGEVHVEDELRVSVNLNEKLQIVKPRLEEMRKRKEERKRQFVDVIDELKRISKEIFGTTQDNFRELVVDDETDLSLGRLLNLQNQLQQLQNEKANRLKQVLDLAETLNSLCVVLGMDFKHVIRKIHPDFDESKGLNDITDGKIERLTTAIQSLQDVKLQRIKKLRDLEGALLELWDLMDTPVEDQMVFLNVLKCIAASESEITEPNVLSIELINQVEEEVLRLKQLKSSKVKEIVLKKRLELEEICRNLHIVTEVLVAPDFSFEAVSSGAVDPVHLLGEIEHEIAKVKGEASSRKEILDKVEKWLAACEEECWLEEYNKNDNRYNAGKGAHIILKRAEKARAAVNKIPAMVEALILKIEAWEKERGNQFLYDGERLLSRLEEYNYLRKEKEQDKIRQRDQKKRQVQLMAEKEAIFGAKPSPLMSGRKPSRASIGVASNRKLSLGGAILQNFKAEKAAPSSLSLDKIGDSMNQKSSLGHQQYGAFASQTFGRRCSEIGGHVVKKQSSAKIRPTESHFIRKPLSPIPLTMSYSKANIANFAADTQLGKTSADPSCIKTPIQTPIRTPGGDKVTITPKTHQIPVPTTPNTASGPMLMASTPATPYVSSGIITCTARKAVEQIEYSFEEVRAGVLYPEAQTQRLLQV